MAVVTNCTPQGLANAMNTLNGTSGGVIYFPNYPRNASFSIVQST